MDPDYCVKFGNETSSQSSLSATTRKEGDKVKLNQIAVIPK